MILWKWCTQYASKFGKLSSGHRTGKGQFSFQSQRKAMPKNVQSESKSLSVMSDSLRPHGLSPWNSPGQNTGVGSLFLLQGIFLTQGSNPGLPLYRWILVQLSHKVSHFTGGFLYRWILVQLSHKGSPRILGWVAYPFSRGSAQPRNWTGISCIAGGF